MNHALDAFAEEIALNAPGHLHLHLRLRFGHACTQRIGHLLEEPAVMDCLAQLGYYLESRVTPEAVGATQLEADRLANQHCGSQSIDGGGHAAALGAGSAGQCLNSGL